MLNKYNAKQIRNALDNNINETQNDIRISKNDDVRPSRGNEFP